MARWTFVIDLRKCIGCEGCTIVCSHEHGLPPGRAWRQIVTTPAPTGWPLARICLPLSCQHCENPPCDTVCPNGATYQRPDGVVAIHTDRCMGCSYCVLACPYQARTIIDSPSPGLDPELRTRLHGRNPASQGVCTKCDACVDRVDAGIKRGRVPGRDPEATPLCAITCLPGAVHFGDRDDPTSAVSGLIEQNPVHRLEESLGTAPSVYYILPSAGGAEPAAAVEAHSQQAATEPWVFVPHRKQTVWGHLALANFALGGAGAGLYLWSAWEGSSPVTTFTSVALMAAGFAAVSMEAGHPWRARFILSNLRRSWMSREALFALVFVSGALAGLLWPWAKVTASVGAAGFVLSQALIFKGAQGIPDWQRPTAGLVMLLSSLVSGFGPWLVLAGAPATLPMLAGTALFALGMWPKARLFRTGGYHRAIGFEGKGAVAPVNQ